MRHVLPQRNRSSPGRIATCGEGSVSPRTQSAQTRLYLLFVTRLKAAPKWLGVKKTHSNKKLSKNRFGPH
jgi:hypothetical protein